MGYNRCAAHGTSMISADEAAALVKSAHHVAIGMASPLMTPFAFVRALAARAPELHGVTVEASWTRAAASLITPGTEASWSTSTMFAYTDAEFSGLNALNPQVNYIPMNPSFFGWMADYPQREELTRRYTGADVFVVGITPANAAGYVTFGTNLWNARMGVRNARIVIGEIKRDLPIIPGGDNWMPVEAFDYLIEGEQPEFPAIFAETPEEEVDPSQVCALYTAELINNGDTVMFGGGAMPIRLAPFLEDKEDLGCHSEVVFPVDLARKGVITNKKRNLVPGKTSLTGFIPKSEAERQWVDGNPTIDLRDMHVNNHPRYIAQNDNLVAVNAPLEITLWGEIGIERVGPRYFRGVGGQVEFVVGAILSKGGRSIHSVLSKKKTVSGEYVSTIVPEFTPPGVASISRQFADIVVTEFGVARLMGKTERERAQELISIAHPDFQPALREAARKAFGLGTTTFAGRSPIDEQPGPTPDRPPGPEPRTAVAGPVLRTTARYEHGDN